MPYPQSIVFYCRLACVGILTFSSASEANAQAIQEQKQIIWNVPETDYFVVKVRPAVKHRSIAWTEYKGKNQRLVMRLRKHPSGYDFSVYPTDSKGRRKESPFNSRQPVRWDDLPETLTVTFTPAARELPDGRVVTQLVMATAYGGDDSNAPLFRLEDYSEEVKSLVGSRWQSNYKALNGNRYDATLQLDERQGSYDGAASGKLSQLHYFQDEGEVILDGVWKSGRFRGRFVYEFDEELKSFQGRYTLDGKPATYEWNGVRQ